MSRLGIAYSNLVDSSTLSTPGAAAAGHGVDQLQQWELAKYWEAASTGANDMTVRMDHGSAKPARVLLIVAWGGSGDTTVTMMRGTTAGSSNEQSGLTVPAWAFAPLDDDRDGSHFIIPLVAPAETTARYTTVTFSGSTPVRVGRMFLGRLFVAPYAPNRGEMGEGWMSPNSTVDRTENGADWPHERTEMRHKEMTLRGLSAAQLSLLREITRTHGLHREVGYLPDINDRALSQQFGFLGLLRELSTLQRLGLDLGEYPIAIDERGGAL
jgi:hypothetical protein